MEIKTWITDKIDYNELTWEEFLELIFPRQVKMRECADKILNYVKNKPATLNEIIEQEKLVRGTAYDTFNVLRRFGLVSRKDKYTPLMISGKFGNSLERLAKYWKTWQKE